MVLPFFFPLILSISLLDQADTRVVDMREHFVIDPLIGKRQQLLLATQLCRMVLKVCVFFSSLLPLVCPSLTLSSPFFLSQPGQPGNHRRQRRQRVLSAQISLELQSLLLHSVIQANEGGKIFKKCLYKYLPADRER